VRAIEHTSKSGSSHIITGRTNRNEEWVLGLVETKRPIGVVLIAVVNLLIYVPVLVFAVISPFTAHPYYGSGWNAVYFFAGFGMAYSIVGIVGVLGLLVRWRSFSYPAMLGWVVETVIFSTLCFFSYANVFSENGTIIGRIWNTRNFTILLSLVAFKLASIAYFVIKRAKAQAKR
jgi:protein-S-isoprenylcysteine O-methyltransferase Ste14